MFVVDTNILLYVANADAPEHRVCRELLLKWQNGDEPWHLTWSIVYEFLRVATHRDVFQEPLTLAQAWSFISSLLAPAHATMLLETERHSEVLSEVFAAMPSLTGNLVFDAHTAILMREHGVRTIYTRDKDFRRFPFLDVVDPLAP